MKSFPQNAESVSPFPSGWHLSIQLHIQRPPGHGGISTDGKHLLFDDIGNSAYKSLNENIQVTHFGKHGVDSIGIYATSFNSAAASEGKGT
jgi:hypothetical protein